MEDLIKYLITNAIGVTDIEITKTGEGGAEIYEIKVPKDSMGLVIGKSGNTIKAIRNIVKIKATIEKKKVDINLIEA